MDRLDIGHELWLKTLDGRLHLAPINKSDPRVLDMGTGTGIWAIDFGMLIHFLCQFLLMNL